MYVCVGGRGGGLILGWWWLVLGGERKFVIGVGEADWNCIHSKILNTFFILFSNKMLVIKAGIQEMLVRIANRDDPDQTACFGLFWQASSVQNFRKSAVDHKEWTNSISFHETDQPQ